MVPETACLIERNTIPFQIVKETVERNKVYSTVVNRNCISQSLMKINKNRPTSANIKDILNFAMRRMSVTKRDVLTDQMVCQMIKDMFLEVWLTSYFNVNFYSAKVTKQYYTHNSSYTLKDWTGGAKSEVGKWLKNSTEAKKIKFGDRQKVKSVLRRIQKFLK